MARDVALECRQHDVGDVRVQEDRPRRLRAGLEGVRQCGARRWRERLDERRHERVERNQAALQFADALRGFLEVLHARSFGRMTKARTRRAFVGGCRALPDTRRPRSVQPKLRMREACGPFWPCVTSNSTRWFSVSVLKPLPWISLKCAKRSLPPSSGAMKPKPLPSLNHFTVPVWVVMSNTFQSCPTQQRAQRRNAKKILKRGIR